MPFDAPRYEAPPPKSGHHGTVIVGGGLVGLTLALDLARRGVASVLLDDDDTVSTGSRAICMAKRSLEIFGRLGLGRRMLDKGVTWNTGRVFFQDRELFGFDLLPELGHEYPAFINLQQYYAEAWLVEACAETGLVDLRWRHALTGFDARPDGVTVHVQAPGGAYALEAEWLLACDGSRSQVRRGMDLPFVGRVFHDRFLIADVVMQAAFPTERWFWFDPPFNPNQSALLHKQPDDVWRIDLQLGWDADTEEETKPERVIPRIQAMLGPQARFTLEWVSLYTFRCRRLERFVHGRVVFVGDSAHQVSPFGARGGNGGVQDADNLGWKLASVLQGQAPAALIDSYDAERIPAADENILHSTRATDFITPKTPAARAYRDAALHLAADHPFARAFINSGRLSRPATLSLHPGPDTWPGAPRPGIPAIDAPVGDGDWLLHHIGPNWTLLRFDGQTLTATLYRTPSTSWPGRAAQGSACGSMWNGCGGLTRPSTASDTNKLWPQCEAGAPTAREHTQLHDTAGLVAARYAAPPGAAILFRPDQHIAALFRHPDPARIHAAIADALSHRVPVPA